MSEQNRAPQPYDDGPRPHTDADQAPIDQQAESSAFAMPPAEASAQAAPVGTGESITAPAAEEAPAEVQADMAATERTPQGVGSGSTAAEPAPAAAEASFANETSPRDDRLSEALERSRNIPLDGSYEVAEEPRPESRFNGTTHPAPAAAGASAAGASPWAQPDARREGEPATAADHREVAANTASAAPEAAAATEPRDTADTVNPEADAAADERTGDEQTFAPLGISATEGLLIKPEKPSNRGFAAIMAILATIVFAVGYATAFTLVRMAFTPGTDFMTGVTELMGSTQFYIPVAAFFVVFTVWSLLANRARWWGYIVASQVIALAVVAAYYVGVMLGEVFADEPMSLDLFMNGLKQGAHLPGALIAALVAMPTVAWFGGLSAMRGRRLSSRYERELAEYDRKVEFEREHARNERANVKAE